MPEIERRTKVGRGIGAPTIEPVAEGVWLMRGGAPKRLMNVYMIAEAGGIALFDGGISSMTRPIAQAAEELGGLKRIVLGHSHHRGAAAGLGARVFCHPDEAADVEGDGGQHYFDYSKIDNRLMRFITPRVIRSWDGGPIAVAGTLSEGDQVADFEVKHFPGHAPGQIGLWRESDRLALVSDTIYMIDQESLRSRTVPPRAAHPFATPDTEAARESIRKLAALDPASVWPGHAGPLTGNCRAQLAQAEHAAN